MLVLVCGSDPVWADIRVAALPRVAAATGSGLIGPVLPGPMLAGASRAPAPPLLPTAQAGVQAPIPAVHAGLLCRRAIQMAGRAAGIPDHLMSAIGRIESGRRGPDGQVHPWPWSINAEGTDHVYDTREQAIAAVRAMQAQGMRSIDIGCMQVNLLHHPTAFPSLEQAFDPSTNATYAAKFLAQLYAQTGSWQKATGMYHSATPELGSAYQLKVAAVLAEETQTDSRFASTGIPLPPHLAGTGPTSGPGPIMLSNRSAAARIIPQLTQGPGRGLDAYRAAPIRVATRAVP